MRVWLPLLLLMTVAACDGPREDPSRYQFGVSGDRPAVATSAAADQEMRAYLDTKARQVCTLGYNIQKVDTLGAEGDRQIVDLDLRCRDYRPGFLPDPAMLADIF